MPDSPCLAKCRELYEAITARTLGQQVQSVGHKGRQVGYSDTSLGDMIALYRQLWAQCPDAQAELPTLKPLEQPTGTRGRPAQFLGKGHV